MVLDPATLVLVGSALLNYLTADKQQEAQDKSNLATIQDKEKARDQAFASLTGTVGGQQTIRTPGGGYDTQ